MKLQHFVRTTAVVAVVMVAGLIASPALADVWTDGNVYQAGDTVSISGNGMLAGESVGVEVLFPDSSLAQHHDVLADDQGNFADTYTLPSGAPSGDYTVVAMGAESGQTFTTTFDPNGAGALNCPLPVHNPTHYKLQVGTTVTCTIDGASEVSGQTTTSVFIKSSTLGNTELTGTVTGTGGNTQITFTFTAPPDGCDTTVVAYDKVGTNSNNSIITTGGHSAAGLAYVDGAGNVIECGGGGSAHVSILKVADQPSVTAGESIGFTITVSSDGTATAQGVQVSDTLPTDAGTSWSIDGGTGAGDCGIALGVLSCNFGNMAASSSLSVHISSPTTKVTANDSPVINTASVSSTNAGSADSTDQVEVICPRVALTLRADKATVHTGASTGFTALVARRLQGRTYGIALTGTLPSGLSWAIDGGTGASKCSLSGSSLTCSFGDMDQGMSYSVHVSAVATRTGTMIDKASVTGASPLVYSTGKATITVV
jgi:uncharacterized repeat protein (TIGR01451 family)